MRIVGFFQSDIFVPYVDFEYVKAAAESRSTANQRYKCNRRHEVPLRCKTARQSYIVYCYQFIITSDKDANKIASLKYLYYDICDSLI